MIKQVLPLAALLAVAACGGAAVISPPDGGGGGGGSDSIVVPDALKVNLTDVDFDGTTMKVTIASLDSTPTEVTYDRDARLDVPGYTAYRMQEDSLDRIFVALGAISEDNSVAAVTAGDGGQFNRYFAGGSYSRAGSFDAPTIGTGPAAGQVSYAGSYAAVTNIPAARNGDTDVAIPIPDPSAIPAGGVPGQPSRVTGDIFLNANFADNSVNGSIYNRQLVDDNNSQLAAVILVASDIAEDGTFVGGTENVDQRGTGTYGGIFGGAEAHSVAGLVHLTEVANAQGIVFENGQEHGVFVLTQCGPDNTLPVCGNVAP